MIVDACSRCTFYAHIANNNGNNAPIKYERVAGSRCACFNSPPNPHTVTYDARPKCSFLWRTGSKDAHAISHIGPRPRER